MDNQPLSPTATRSSPLTLRSVLLGLAGVVFVCGLAPYNDFVMENTLLIGNFLPIGLLLILMLLVLGVNVPVRRFFPAAALRQGELAVVTLMVLVACSVPSSGLMRYLPAGIVGIYTQSADRPGDYGPAVDAAHVPEWLLPTTPGRTAAAERGNTDVYTQFRGRAPDGRVPWAAWVRPFFAWGVLIALLWGLLISLSLIVRRQWVENERLSFPLATLYESLIETPPPGHALNALFRSPGFWIAAGAVFALRAINALHAYDADFPSVPLGYDLRPMLSDPPWGYTYVTFKTADLYFSMVGIAFFIQTKTAFSLWSCFLAWQAAEMTLGTLQIPTTEVMRQDETYGAAVVFAAVVLYLGRRHWWTVLRHMAGAGRAGEVDDAYVPFAVSGWAACFCFAGIVGWLLAVGMTFFGAITLGVTLAATFMIIARVLADTGLIFVQINTSVMRGFNYPILIPQSPQLPTQTNFFFAGWFTHLFHDLRESLAAFFQLGMRVTDDAVPARDRPRRVGVGLLGTVVLSLAVAYVVSWGSMLWVEYHYAQTVSDRASVINPYGTTDAVRVNVLDPAVALNDWSRQTNPQPPRGGPLGNPLIHLGLGGGLVAACSLLRVLVAWWPIHPVALVVVYSYAMQKIWLSLFVGWVAKVVVVRFGGASLLRRGRPVFIGLILGDAFAAAVVLVLNVVLHASGYAYKPLVFLPG